MKNLRINVLRNLQFDNQWENFRVHFERVHPSFFTRLKEKSSELSTNDLRHCAYIKMGLKRSEIAHLLNIIPKSVQISRIRLKKKLQIPQSSDLMEFITNL